MYCCWLGQKRGGKGGHIEARGGQIGDAAAAAATTSPQATTTAAAAATAWGREAEQGVSNAAEGPAAAVVPQGRDYRHEAARH